jgi:hypothetical protein
MFSRKRHMPCIAPEVRKTETAAEKLSRLRTKIAASPTPKISDTSEVQRHKLAVFQNWAATREKATKVA